MTATGALAVALANGAGSAPALVLAGNNIDVAASGILTLPAVTLGTGVNTVTVNGGGGSGTAYLSARYAGRWFRPGRQRRHPAGRQQPFRQRHDHPQQPGGSHRAGGIGGTVALAGATVQHERRQHQLPDLHGQRLDHRRQPYGGHRHFSAGAGTVNAASPLAISNTLKFSNGALATISNGQTFTAAGGNLASTSTPSTLALSGGTLSLSTAQPAGVVASALAWWQFKNPANLGRTPAETATT